MHKVIFFGNAYMSTKRKLAFSSSHLQLLVFMVLSSNSPVNNRRDSTGSLNRSGISVRSGYMLAQGKSPDETWLSRFISEYLLCGCICDPRKPHEPALTDDEEDFLEFMRSYMERPFDSSNPDHLQLFKSVWRSTFPGTETPKDVDEKWTKLGFQSSNPRTDIRTGLHSLESLEYLSRNYTEEFRIMVIEASDSASEYPFAASCASLAFSLIIFFKLNTKTAVNPVGSASGTRTAIKQFIRLSLLDRNAFDEIFCALVRRVHKEWMRQTAGSFDIHYFAIALSIGMSAVAELFNSKRIRDMSDLRQIIES
jgi:hypothetical protein